MARVFWNPNDKGSALILTNSNLSARCPTGSVARSSARANTIKTTGKWYFEIINLDGGVHRIGWSTDIALTAGDLNTSLPYTIYAGVGWSTGRILDPWELANKTYGDLALTVNDVVMTAIDLTGGGKVWFGLNGSWFVGNPALGTFPADSWTGGPVNILPFVTVDDTALADPQVTGRFKTEDFSYTPPSGFSALEVSPVSAAYDHVLALFAGGGIVWGTDDLHVALVDDLYAFDAAHTDYADISAFVMTDASYDPSSLVNASSSDSGLDAEDTRFTALYGSAAALVLYKNAMVGGIDRPLIFYSALIEPLTTMTFFGGALKIRWGASGLLVFA